MFKDVCVEGCGAYGANIGAQARNRACGFEAHRSLIKSRPDRTAASKPASRRAGRSPGGSERIWPQQGSQDGRFQDTVELATGRVAVPRQTISVIIMESRNSPEPLGPGELLFF